MMQRKYLFAGLALFLATLAFPARADTAAAEPLHVIRPLLHVEQEEAELCLEFDHPLDAVSSAGHIAGLMHLESEGRIISVLSKTISLGGEQLCVSPLEHGKDYRFSLAALHDAKGEKLSPAYGLAFTVPRRHPALAFANQQSKDGLIIWRDNPVLRSVNSPKVTLELYRISDPTALAEAWGQRLQTSLAPSESLYFARHNGTLVWKSEIEPQKAPDRNVESKIDFASNSTSDFAPGLYLLAATAGENENANAAADKDDSSVDNPLTTVAAAWLLRSHLHMQAMADDRSVTVFTEAADASAPVAHVHVLALDHDQHIVAEGHSDGNGAAALTLKADATNAAQTLLGITDAGDVAFLDAARDVLPNPSLPSLTTSLVTDQTLYAPSDIITAALAAHDLHKHPASLTGSSLQLLRADRSLYESQAVTLDTTGAAKLSLTAPATNGLWHLVWKQSDGVVLADVRLRVSANPEAPEISVTADHTSVAEDGSINLTIRSASGKKPVPMIEGHVELAWQKALHPFAAWKDYLFDDGKAVDPAPHAVAFFLTDANGTAHMRLALPAEAHDSALRQAEVRVVSDPSLGALDPPPLSIGIKPGNPVVGIKPSVSNGHFPENSMAHFSVIVVDGDEQRRTEDNLTYQIYEQGRSFEWHQSDGHWDYKPQQQRRRIGGGSLALMEDSPTSIEWPVTSGAYRIDITNADGKLVAREDFNAGWSFSESDPQPASALVLTATPAVLSGGKEQSINFTLPHPAFVTAIIADDHIRSILHHVDPAGANSIRFTPAADWGSRVNVRVQAHFAELDNTAPDTTGQIILDSAVDIPAPPHATFKTNSPNKLIALSNFDWGLHVTQQQNLAPQQEWLFSAAKLHTASFLFAAPVPLFNAPYILAALLATHPQSTREIAQQLEILRLWHDSLLAATLMTESEMHLRESNLLSRLLNRQNADGGFAPTYGSAGSDIISTAAVMETLNGAQDATSTLAVEQAGAWLRHHLDNTWFEEDERAPRAAAYAALAMAGKLDLASLHYFSDTSAEKKLPALTSAQMAYAFASIKDKPAADFWLGKIRRDGAAFYDVASLPVLLINPYFTSDDAMDDLARALRQAETNLDNPEEAADVLIALGHAEDRRGTWRIIIGKDEKTLHGILAMPLNEKTSLTIHNPSSDHALSLVVAALARPAAARNDTRRHVTKRDGGDVSGRLQRGETYVVMIEGAWPEEADASLMLHDNPSPVLLPITCAIEAPSADSFLGWLSYTSLTAAVSCERSADGLDILIKRGEKDSRSFRIAYLAKAGAGDLRNLSPVSIVADRE